MNESTAALLFEDFKKALNALNEALVAEKSDIQRDAAIQRFEFTIELAWKLMQRVLYGVGFRVNSPKSTFREAAREEMISDPQAWIDYWNVRNLTAHTYKEQMANEVYEKISGFLPIAFELVKNLEGRLK